MENSFSSNQTSSVTSQKDGILRQFEATSHDAGWGAAFLTAGAILLIIAGGITTGYFLSHEQPGSSAVTKTTLSGGQELVASAKEVGVKDKEAFPDITTGKIEVNDFSEVDEGSHRLLRLGGKSQTAYLTSSAVDLDQFVGQCVEIWGETHSAQKAGWLMDVGYLKVLDSCPEGL